MPNHRQPMGRPATMVLMIPVGCVLATAGDWHLIGTEDGRILRAVNRYTNESMPQHQLVQLSVPPEEFAKAQAAVDPALAVDEPSAVPPYAQADAGGHAPPVVVG